MPVNVILKILVHLFLIGYSIYNTNCNLKTNLINKKENKIMPKASQQWVDFKEIKVQISLEKILEHYGILKTFKRRGDNLIGPCPIHKGTNHTQFHISLAKNNFNCFGHCKKGGNVIDFVCAMEGFDKNNHEDFRQAALLIQEWFEITSQSQPSASGPGEKPLQALTEKPTEQRSKEKDDPDQVVNPPLKFALKNLDSDHPYLYERGFTKETIQAFGLGFCSKGIMAGRIAIPIHNHAGELVAYLGRWPEDIGWPEGEGKYKLPPVFYKSMVLFNFHRAKEFARVQGLILVEGVFDCLKVWQAGFKNVVALLGSQLSEEQERLMVEAVGPGGKVALMFDEDAAGWSCRDEVSERLISCVYVKVIRLGDEGLQPDSLAEEEIKKLLSS